MLNEFFKGVMPLPPSTNQAYRVIYVKSQPRLGPSEALKQFKCDAGKTLLEAEIDLQQLQSVREAKCKTPLSVSLVAYFSSMWRRDLDGIVKFSIDAVFECLQFNDNLIVELDARKLVDIQPRVEITLAIIR